MVTLKSPAIKTGRSYATWLSQSLQFVSSALYHADASTTIIMIRASVFITDVIVVHADRPLLYYASCAGALAGLVVLRANDHVIPRHEAAPYRAQEDAVVAELLEVILLASLDSTLGSREGEHLGDDLGEEPTHQRKVGVDDSELWLEDGP